MPCWCWCWCQVLVMHACNHACISIWINKHTTAKLRLVLCHSGSRHVAPGCAVAPGLIAPGYMACTIASGCFYGHAAGHIGSRHTLFTDTVRIVLVRVLYIVSLNLVRILVRRSAVRRFWLNTTFLKSFWKKDLKSVGKTSPQGVWKSRRKLKCLAVKGEIWGKCRKPTASSR